MVAYLLLVAAFAVERLVELRVSLRNARESFARGGVEYGQGHYPLMVLVHTLFLLACPLEVFLFDRPFIPWLGIPALLLCLGTQGLRWWVIRTLGWRWNTRVIVVPNLPLVTEGPFRYFNHPNYLAVVLEMAALPLVHGAWISALVFSLANAGVLWLRLRVEERALGRLLSSHGDAGLP